MVSTSTATAKGRDVTETKFKVTLCRTDQPAHQMAEMSMTVPGSLLLGMIRAAIGEQDERGLKSWLGGEEDGTFNFGTLRSLTITRVEHGDI